jgi:hypothetical protein
MNPIAETDDTLHALPAFQPPATMGEAWDANFKAAGLSAPVGVQQPRREAVNDLLDAYSRTTGKSVFEAADDAGMPISSWAYSGGKLNGKLTSSEQAELTGVAGVLASRLPDAQARQVEPFLDVDARAAAKAQQLEAQAAEVNARTYGLSDNAAAWVGGLARGLADPTSIAGAVMGGPEAGPILSTLGREFAINAGIGGAVHEVNAPERRALGLQDGSLIGDAFTAGVYGAGLSMLLRGAGYALKRSFGRGHDEAPPAAAPPNAAAPADLLHEAGALTPEDFEAAARHQDRETALDALAPVQTFEGRAQARQATDAAAASLETDTPSPAFAPKTTELGADGTAHPEAPAEAGVTEPVTPAQGADAEWSKLWSAYQDARREQGGFATAPIATLIERSGLARDRVHALLAEAAKTGDATIHNSNSVRGLFEPTPENKANWLYLPGRDSPYQTAALRNERRAAASEDDFPGDVAPPAPPRAAAPAAPAWSEPTAGKAPQRPQTLRAFVKKLGGVKGEHGDLKDLRKGYPGLVNNKRGLSLDEARQAAAEAGYFGVPIEEKMASATMADMVDALRDDRNVYSARDEAALHEFESHRQNAQWIEQVRNHAREVDAWMAETGEKLDAEHRWTAAELLAEDRLHGDGGMSVDDAAERAANVLYQRDAEAAHAKGEATHESGNQGGGGDSAGVAGGGQGRRDAGAVAVARQPVRDAGADRGTAGGESAGEGGHADLGEPALAAQRADVERGLAAAEAAGEDLKFMAADGTPVSAREALSAVDEFKAAAKELGACILKFGE